MALPVSVPEYYAGKSIFITGATGFMGKVLVQKLLRSCPDVRALYLLMRPKKGMSVEDRLQDFVSCEVFDKLHADAPKSFHKLRLVAGDGAEDHLGISEADQKELQQECQIIFHCAASVRFDMFIKDAVNINVVGTMRMLQFAETMKNLEVFLHMSTAYCHDYLNVLEEKMYPSMHKPSDIMNLVQWMDDDILKRIEHKIIQPLPNSYTYTKELSEELVAQYAGRFTIAVARPSIVVAAHEHPIPGWINNLNGPTGLLVAAAKGVFRVMHTLEEVKPDIIPVDIAVNATILLAYTTGLEQPKEIRVCNITNSGRNTHSWAEQSRIWHKDIQECPFSQCIWYPNLICTESRRLYQIQAIFMHWLPALLIDLLLTLFRRRRFMIRVQKRLHNGLELLSHYMTGNWEFKNDYFFNLRNLLSKEDRLAFFTEYEKIEGEEYGKNYIRGARVYCAKDPLSTIPKAKRQMKFLYYLDVTFKLIFLWWFLNMLYYLAIKLF